METISTRELQENSADVLRRVAAGESVFVSDGGVPVAVLSPPALSVLGRLEVTGRLTQGTGVDLARLPTPVTSEVDTGALLEVDRSRRT
ncbi:type II toxin-antitoxin system Phd/YefM family antitoxin [Pengzhenrongella sp.]|jgi:prevent-host-death family protein|uniref:type II toxin-antitoxin system Phd/YefM family antitoxin n=1 Tax=Pengzhenrongella sp. TaxID=2888820 RepID=UPI0039C913D9